MIKCILVVLSLSLISGCASTYKHSEFQAPTSKLDSTKGILISTPKNGWYGNTQYRNSGRMTANAIKAAFSKNAKKADVTRDCKGDECLSSIDIGKYGYYVKPIILHWEDRATEWSGKPDRVEIQMVVFDVLTKGELANSSYTGTSKWATFGGDHPQDLLHDPTNEYVSSLYR